MTLHLSSDIQQGPRAPLAFLMLAPPRGGVLSLLSARACHSRRASLAPARSDGMSGPGASRLPCCRVAPTGGVSPGTLWPCLRCKQTAGTCIASRVRIPTVCGVAMAPFCDTGLRCRRGRVWP